MKKPQSTRAKEIRKRRAERRDAKGHCPEHGHAAHTGTKYRQAERYLCGCLTGEIREQEHGTKQG